MGAFDEFDARLRKSAAAAEAFEAKVKLLEDIFLTTRFSSEEKLERMQALLEEHLDWGVLQQALGSPA